MKSILTVCVFTAALFISHFATANETAEQAFKLLASESVGTVSTIDKDKPFLSVMPYVLTEDGRPIVLISDLAQHTDNITKNPNASFMVVGVNKDENVFTNSRITLIGKFQQVKDDEKKKEFRKLYLKQHHKAILFADFSDFNFYTFEIDRIFYVGGFGDVADIDWVSVKDFKAAAQKGVK